MDRLQASGLLERRPDPADRRIWRLHLLPAAGPVLDELAEQRASLVAMLTSRIEPAAVAVLTDALLRMRATLSRRPDADAGLAAIEETACCRKLSPPPGTFPRRVLPPPSLRFRRAAAGAGCVRSSCWAASPRLGRGRLGSG